MKKTSVFLIICLCLNIFSVCVFAEDITNDISSDDVMSAFEQTVLNESYSYEQKTEVREDETVPCNVTLQDDFSDNLIIVYIKKEYSKLQQTYTAQDFSYLELSKVETVFEYVPEENNRVGLFLYLQQGGKQNVLDAIDLLLQDEKIYLACPDMIYSVEVDSQTSSSETESIIVEYTGNILTGTCCAHKYTNPFMGHNAPSNVAPIKVGVVDVGICNVLPYHPKFFSNVNFEKTANGVTKSWTYKTPLDMHGSNMISIITKPAENTAEIHQYGCNNPVYEGICPNSHFYSLNVFYMNGNQKKTYLSCITEAINHARSVGIKVLNMSIEISRFSLDENEASALKNAFDAVVDQFNGLIITSAGNDWDNNDDDVDWIDSDPSTNINTALQYPRGCPSDKVIVVGAAEYGSQGTVKRDTSAYGQTSVDLFAHNEAYGYTCKDANGNYDSSENFTQWNGITDNITRCKTTGTSNAAARVTGAAAVLWDICRDLTPAQVKHYLLAGVDKHSSLTNYCVTGGTLDIYRSAKMLISDMACDSETVFAGHFTKPNEMQVAAYTTPTATSVKCFVWTYNKNTGEFSDPELWFTHDGFNFTGTANSNKYRSVAGNFYGQENDNTTEICTLYDGYNSLMIHKQDGSYTVLDLNVPVGNFTGRVTVGNYDGDGFDEIAAFYKVPGVFAHTKLYVWNLTSDAQGNISLTQSIAYDSGAGVFETDYFTDRIASGDFNGDGKDEIAALYYYPSNAKYMIFTFTLVKNSGNVFTATKHNPPSSVAPSDNENYVDVTRVTGRVLTCNYNGGDADEIVCMYNNPERVDGIINHGFTIDFSNDYSWEKSELYKSIANSYNADMSTHLLVAGNFDEDSQQQVDGEDIVAFYKVPSNAENVRGRILMSLSASTNYILKWDGKW